MAAQGPAWWVPVGFCAAWYGLVRPGMARQVAERWSRAGMCLEWSGITWSGGVSIVWVWYGPSGRFGKVVFGRVQSGWASYGPVWHGQVRRGGFSYGVDRQDTFRRVGFGCGVSRSSEAGTGQRWYGVVGDGVASQVWFRLSLARRGKVRAMMAGKVWFRSCMIRCGAVVRSRVR